MKVLIATQSVTLDSPVAKRFGHAPHYLITDTEQNGLKVIDNLEHDDTHSIIPAAEKAGVEVFISGNIGPTAYQLIRSLNMRVTLARQMSAQQALQKLKQYELKYLEAPTLKQSVHQSRQHRKHK